MLNKKVFLPLIFTMFILSACGNSQSSQAISQSDTKSQQTIKNEDSKVIEKKTENSSTNNDEKDNTLNSQDKTKTQEETYKNEKLGFSFVMPESWKGKYSIKEKENGVYICFKPIGTVSSEYTGLLFSITKRTSPEDEDHLDTVGEPRTFIAKGTTYIVGGPTDVTFPTNNKEFNTFSTMQKEIKDVVKTIKID